MCRCITVSRIPILTTLLAVGQLHAAPATVPLTGESKPLSPEAALASMRVAPGYRVELVAAEPLVMDPVAFDWGPDGRLWVAEMRDYPNGLTWNKPDDPLDAPGGRIKVLTDNDGDGRYDEAEIFLDGLSYPSGVKVWDKGILVTAAPEIFYAEDIDGDGKADKREVWYDGFAKSNQQHRVNGLAWGLDNWLHVANGDGGGIILSQENRDEVDIRGFDLRLDPFTKRHEPLNGRTQCGRFRDDWDNWFGCNNSNPLWHYPYPWHLLRRNPEVAVPRANFDVPREPGAAPVYPISQTVERFNQPDRANRFTSACGPTIYRDVLLGESLYGNAFICEPVHNLVSRQVIVAKSTTFTSDRHPDEATSEFFASTDPWSRPVSVRTGPDGAIWIADMYRFVIEHPEWIPKEWQQKLDLRAGSELGRIYRVVPDVAESPKIPRLDGLDDAGLVAQLESPNGTARDLVHQMLLWRRSAGAPALLKEMARYGRRPTARMHALCVLDGLDTYDWDLLNESLADPHPGVVRHALRISSGRFSAPDLAARFGDAPEDAFVAKELAAVLDQGHDDAPFLMEAILEQHRADPVVTAVALSSVNGANLEEMLTAFLSPDPVTSGISNEVLTNLARMAAKWKDVDSIARAVNAIVKGGTPAQDWQLALFTGLLDGDARMEALASDERSRAGLRAILDEIRATVADSGRTPEERAAAGRFLGSPAVFDGDRDLVALVGLMTPQSHSLLQEAALEALGRARHPKTPDVLADRWSDLTPSVRSKTLALLLGRADWTIALLVAIEAGTIPRAEIDAASQKRLLDSKDAPLRERAAKLFASAANTSRDHVLKAHADIAGMKGDPAAGKTVFGAVCIACHVAEGTGNPVGPDLGALTDRSPDARLIALLDPNRAVEDKFVNYTVTTTDGSTVYGVVADESANTVTIRQADGSARSLPRNEIATMASTGISLMPEGFENILTKQQITDLIAYLASLP